MTEYEAVIAAGLDLWRWEQPDGYPMWFRANVLAWHKSHGLKLRHSEDAVSTHLDKQRKKRGQK